MYRSKAICGSPGEHLLLSVGLQPASNSSCVTATPLAANARCLCSAASKTSSPSPCLRPCLATSQIWGSMSSPRRRSAFEQVSTLQCPPLLLTIRASSQPQQRFLRPSTSYENTYPSLPFFRGPQLRSRVRLCRVLNADVNPEVEVDVEPEENEHTPEVNLWTENEDENAGPHMKRTQLQEQLQRKKLRNRIVFGSGIGAAFLGIVLAGGWVFTLAFSLVIWVATGEYFELVRSKSNVDSGMTPPPPVAAKVCAAICSLMPIMTLYFGGRMGVVMTTSAFGLATVLLLQKAPRFSQLTSAFFGLIYCGYLPSFWIKLRCGLTVPALNTRINFAYMKRFFFVPGTAEVAAGWPILFGGQAHWTVGLVATIISCSAIAAADVFSFLGGKTFGKTPLIAVSPKKTLEGAVVGLSCSVAVTILLSKLLQWPSSTPSSAVLAVLVFMSSLFGDLTESMMKRDAGVKDSGQLIPGHGGILDRVDSYVFTGALVYSFVKIGLPLFGV